MPRKTYSREDVQFHSDGFRESRPAVNVKVYGWIRDRKVWDEFYRSECASEDVDVFTLEWIEANVSENHVDQTFWDCCSSEFDYLEAWATSDEDSLFPDHSVSLHVEGRNGGWIAVAGLPDLEDWDAILLARWRKFERIAKEIAAGIPYQMLCSLYMNEYEWQLAESAERERAAREDIATV